MRFFFALYLCLFVNFVLAQNKQDINWIIGQQSEILLDFSDDSFNILLREELDSFSMTSTNICMSDPSGQLLFYSNGCVIRDVSDAFMQNGAGINPGLVQDFYCQSGTFSSPVLQGGISLPCPSNPDIYYLFNLDLDIIAYDTTTNLDPKRLYYQVIDMSMNDGLGAVIEKNKIAVEDSLALARGQLQAVKHANGTDWWIIVPKAVSNCYHLLLLTSNGIEHSKLECAGESWEVRHGIGQAVFSPDGSKFARFNPWNGLHIFDFDRCEGKLSNPIAITFPQENFQAAGLAISPNSRFLYAAARTRLYQFDLQAGNIPESRILIDTLDTQNFPAFGAVFYLSQLAPDGKIYIAGISSHQFYHVINAPDSLGIACDFMQNSVGLPALNFVSIPNFPNYNLGMADEFCDSTVSTDNSTLSRESEWTIFPNPADTYLVISKSSPLVESGILQFRLFDSIGNALFTTVFGTGQALDLPQLAKGIYIYQIFDEQNVYQSGKLCIEN